MKSRDPQAILLARKRDGCCLWGLRARNGCVPGFDVHHIETVGAGGSADLKNLICLCRRHHQLAQERKIPAGSLKQLLVDFYGYEYEES